MMRAILVKRNDPRSEDEKNELQMNELRELAGAAGYEVIAELTQTRHPDRKYHPYVSNLLKWIQRLLLP